MKRKLLIMSPLVGLLALVSTQSALLAQNGAIRLTLKGGWASASEPVRKVQVVGPHAYLVVGETGLQVLDVSSPTNLVPLGRYDAAQRINGFHVDGNYAFLAEGSFITGTNDPGIMEILDVSQPTHLVHLGSINTQGRANAVHATGDYAYVAESTRWTGSNLVSALEIFRITNYASLTVVGRYETSNAVNDVRVAGHHAYLAGGDAELTVLDVSRPQEPGPIGSFETNSVRHTGSVEVWGENACLVSDGILYVLNVSNPGQPILILTYGRTYPAYPGTTAIHLSKRHFYMAWAVGDWQGPSRAYLHVKDTTDPANWISVANFDLPVTGQDLQVNGSLLFVAFGQAGLWIYEITELPYFRSIARSGEGIVLSWNDLPGLKLQSTPSLTNLAWIDVPGSVGTNQMQLPRSGGHQFFRLVQPATP